MKKTFDFGKIDYAGTGRKAYPVTITVELIKRGGEKTFTFDPKTKERTYTGNTTPEYDELSISGTIWNTKKTDWRCGGQCLDTIKEYRRQLSDPALFDELYTLWSKYHLNGMHAGTPEQETAIDEWEKAGNKYEYKAVCDYLKSVGMYEVVYSGLSVGRRYENESYKYGHAWLVQEIPAEVLTRIKHLISE